jgi:hypothetical protein
VCNIRTSNTVVLWLDGAEQNTLLAFCPLFLPYLAEILLRIIVSTLNIALFISCVGAVERAIANISNQPRPYGMCDSIVDSVDPYTCSHTLITKHFGAYA